MHNNIFEYYFNNLTKVNFETLDEHISVEVEVKEVDIILGSVWTSNDEMIAYDMLFDMGHSNDKTPNNKQTLKHIW